MALSNYPDLLPMIEIGYQEKTNNQLSTSKGIAGPTIITRQFSNEESILEVSLPFTAAELKVFLAWTADVIPSHFVIPIICLHGKKYKLIGKFKSNQFPSVDMIAFWRVSAQIVIIKLVEI